MDEEKNVLYMPPRTGRGPQAIFAALKESAPIRSEGVDTSLPSAQTDNQLQQVAVVYLPLEQIRPSAMPIRIIDESSLTELTNSILERGVIQPVLVRPMAGEIGLYELIAGERRFRAAKLAGLESVPTLITAVDDRDSLELAIIENAQREDLNPIEEALAYQRLAVDYAMTHGEIGEAIGKTRVTVVNSIRLLSLPEEILEVIKTGLLTAGHGRALLMIKDVDAQLKLADRALNEGLSVRSLETMVQRMLAGPSLPKVELDDGRRAALQRWEEKIGTVLKLEKVKLREDSEGRRVVTITFDSDASWRRFMGRMKD